MTKLQGFAQRTTQPLHLFMTSNFLRAWLLILSGITFALAAINLSYADAYAPQNPWINGVVTRVGDGDTIYLAQQGNAGELSIRLIAIDTPELHLKVNNVYVAQNPWGQWSTDYLTRLLPKGTRISVLNFGKDSNNRVLGRLVLNQSRDLNYEMVRSGWAIPFFICEGETCNQNYFKVQNVQYYVQACEYARSQGQGIFNPRAPMHEQAYQFRDRMLKRQPHRFIGDVKTGQYYAPGSYNRVPDPCRRIFFPAETDARNVGFRRGF